MKGTEQVKDARGRLIGLSHASDPLAGAAKGDSPESTARRYLEKFSGVYGLQPEFIAGAAHGPDAGYSPSAPEGLRLAEIKTIRSFTIVSFEQTHANLPVWQGGVVVRMFGADNRVSGSAINIFRDIKIEGLPAAAPKHQDRMVASIKAVVAESGLTGFKLNATRDLIYRYDPEERLAKPEPGAPTSEEPSPPPKLGAVPKQIKAEHFYCVTEVLFTATSKRSGELNYRAFIEWRTDAVLYFRALVAEVTGAVFTNDPISRTGDSQLSPTAPLALLDAQRELRTLERLVLPAAPAPVGLSGEYVTVADLDAPFIAPPTEPGGPAALFTYPANSDNFAAVCAYFNHDRLYRLVETLGFDLPTYFDGAIFPVPVDHHWQNIVNAQAPGNAMGNGILRFRYSLADAASTVGIASDPRVVAHEFGHGILWDHLNSPNFGFAHNLGDALGAILHDPDSQAPDRFRSFPFNNVVLRRCDRSVASGWGWGGTMDLGGYLSEEILATVLFRLYRSLGGDAASLAERRFASRYTIYLMLQGVPLLSGVLPNTPEGYSTAMQESDVGTAAFEGYSGGFAHKVVRWANEKQSLYGGAAPEIDVYIDDGRHGEYPYTSELDASPGIWNRQSDDGGTSHETPHAGATNYLYVRVHNRGSETAHAIRVRGYRAHHANGAIWPADWTALPTAQVVLPVPIAPGESAVVGPFRYCPEGPCEERVLFSVSAVDDDSNADTVGTLPVERLVLADNNVAIRKMTVAAKGCGHGAGCGCGQGCGCAEAGSECHSPASPPWLTDRECFLQFFENRYIDLERFVIRICYEHCLQLEGRVQGPLIYTLTLLPGEEMKLYLFERYRSVRSEQERMSVHSSFRQSVAVTHQTQMTHSESEYSSLSAKVRSEGDSSVTLSGILPFHLEADDPTLTFKAFSDKGISTVSSEFNQSVQTASLAVEAERSIMVSTYEEQERSSSTQRKVRNENPCYAVTYFVRRVMERFAVHTRICGIEIGMRQGKNQFEWLPVDEAMRRHSWLREVLANQKLPQVGDNVRTQSVTLPTDGAVFEPELAHCSSCDPCRADDVAVELAKKRAEVQLACLKAELLALEIQRRRALIDAGTLTPFEPSLSAPREG